MKKHFSFTGAKKIVFGNGSLETLADHIRELKASRPLIVLDRNIAKTGLRERVSDILGNEGFKITFFDRQVEAEPRLEVADEGAKAARKGKCDIVVGIGGGSAMDVAKAIAVLAANNGSERII